MLGEWEVLVLDWGLAVGLSPDAQAQQLLAALAGTPCFVPPEQMGQVDRVGIPSDLYLLVVFCRKLSMASRRTTRQRLVNLCSYPPRAIFQSLPVMRCWRMSADVQPIPTNVTSG